MESSQNNYRWIMHKGVWIYKVWVGIVTSISVNNNIYTCELHGEPALEHGEEPAGDGGADEGHLL